MDCVKYPSTVTVNITGAYFKGTRRIVFDIENEKLIIKQFDMSGHSVNIKEYELEHRYFAEIAEILSALKIAEYYTTPIKNLTENGGYIDEIDVECEAVFKNGKVFTEELLILWEESPFFRLWKYLSKNNLTYKLITLDN